MGQIGIILLLLTVPLADDLRLSAGPAGWWLWPLQLCLPIAAGLLRSGRSARRARFWTSGPFIQNALLGWHAITVVLLGWVAQVRELTGDLVVADELIAALPVLLAWVAGPATLSRLRIEVLPIAIPVLILQTWSESAARYLGPIVGSDWVVPVQLLGVLVLVLVAPLAMRWLWATEPMKDSTLRSRIERALRVARVGVGQILVWNTRGRVANAAVVGVLPGLRYILVSDVLLEALSEDEVESVAAHEIGHVRHRHIVWLMVTIVVMLLLGLGVVGLSGLTGWPADTLALLASAAGVFFGFGLVSRVFERQADAFSVAHLSRSAGDPVVSLEAADVFASALSKVSLLGGMPRRRWTWRHGSIADRQRRVHALVGQHLDGLEPNRAARRALVVVLLLGVVSAAALVFAPAIHG